MLLFDPVTGFYGFRAVTLFREKRSLTSRNQTEHDEIGSRAQWSSVFSVSVLGFLCPISVCAWNSVCVFSGWSSQGGPILSHAQRQKALIGRGQMHTHLPPSLCFVIHLFQF